MKVLLSAYACQPHSGSEPGIGWNLATEVTKHHQVWVVTRGGNRAAIETELEKNPVRNLTFVYYDLPPWFNYWMRGKNAVQVHYPLWQLGVYSLFKQLHEQIAFDVTEHITYGRYWTPSLLSRLPVPFILGPVGGGEAAPRTFLREGDGRSLLSLLVRSLARRVGEFSPLIRSMVRWASLSLATTPETAARFTSPR